MAEVRTMSLSLWSFVHSVTFSSEQRLVRLPCETELRPSNSQALFDHLKHCSSIECSQIRSLIESKKPGLFQNSEINDTEDDGNFTVPITAYDKYPEPPSSSLFPLLGWVIQPVTLSEGESGRAEIAAIGESRLVSSDLNKMTNNMSSESDNNSISIVSVVESESASSMGIKSKSDDESRVKSRRINTDKNHKCSRISDSSRMDLMLKQFVCSECGFRTNQKTTLVIHRQKKHA